MKTAILDALDNMFQASYDLAPEQVGAA